MANGFVNDDFFVDGSLEMTANNNAIILNSGSTAQRPASPQDGMIRHNNSLNSIETYFDSGWNRINNIPDVYNLGFSTDGTTFTVHGVDGTALSADNPGYVRLQSQSTSGQKVLYKITANQSFDDSTGTSDIIGNTFGTTAGVQWAPIMPFYLYAVANDAEDAISFMLCRQPHFVQSPASGNIGTPASAIADSEDSFWALSSITTTDYDSNPCLNLGAFAMSKNASDDWNVTTGIRTGIGYYLEELEFIMPSNQNGAASGEYWLDNGGTAPVFSSNDLVYYVKKMGEVNYAYEFSTVTNTPAGAVSARLPLPMAADSGAGSERFGLYLQISQEAGNSQEAYYSRINNGTYSLFFKTDAGSVGQLNNSAFTGINAFRGQITYRLP